MDKLTPGLAERGGTVRPSYGTTSGGGFDLRRRQEARIGSTDIFQQAQDHLPWSADEPGYP